MVDERSGGGDLPQVDVGPCLAELALDAASAAKLADQLLTSEHIDEAVVLATCNRTEIYASVSRFHGALADATEALSDLAGLSTTTLQSRCAVYFDEGAVAHTSPSPPGWTRW